jgi:hypothetical protein
LSHPLVVDAAQTLFVPACVHNNTDGDADARVRAAFAEPAWNNPVVRVLDAERADLVPRVTDDWSLAGLTAAMVQGRTAAKLAVPAWLQCLHDEASARRRGLERAVFAMG